MIGAVEVELGMTDDFRNVRLLRKAVVFGPVQVQVTGSDGRWVVPVGGEMIRLAMVASTWLLTGRLPFILGAVSSGQDVVLRDQRSRTPPLDVPTGLLPTDRDQMGKLSGVARILDRRDGGLSFDQLLQSQGTVCGVVRIMG